MTDPDPSAAMWRRLDVLVGRAVAFRDAPTPVEDVDGNLIGLDVPADLDDVEVGPIVVTAAELADAGLAAADVPHLTVIDTQEHS